MKNFVTSSGRAVFFMGGKGRNGLGLFAERGVQRVPSARIWSGWRWRLELEQDREEGVTVVDQQLVKLARAKEKVRYALTLRTIHGCSLHDAAATAAKTGDCTSDRHHSWTVALRSAPWIRTTAKNNPMGIFDKYGTKTLKVMGQLTFCLLG